MFYKIIFLMGLYLVLVFIYIREKIDWVGLKKGVNLR